MTNVEKELDQIVVSAVRAHWPEALAIYLFGSVAKGETRPGSDLDVAILVPGGQRLTRTLDFTIPLDYEIDLVDMRNAPTVLQKEVLAGGRRLWATDVLNVEFFELFVFASYQKLNQERADILAAGVASGRFYNP